VAEWLSRIRTMLHRLSRPTAMALQLMLMVVSNRLAFLLRFDGHLPPFAEEAFWQMLPWLVAIRAFVFVPFRLYEGMWRYTSLYDLRAIAGGVAASTGVFLLLTLTPLAPEVYPRSIFVVDGVLLTLLLGGVRMTRRVLAGVSLARPGKRVLIFGAGDAGELIVRDMKHSVWYGYRPIGFIDDDQRKVGHRIHGVPVLGTREDLPRIVTRYKPHEVLLAIPRAQPVAVRSVVRSLERFKIPIKTLPNLRDVIDGRTELSQIRNLSVEDLLARAPVGLDQGPLEFLIGGRRVLVTGAGGSIGSELCRQITRLKPSALIMFERYENSLHAIRLELEDTRQRFGLHPVVGDVTDPIRVEEVMRQYEPEIVFHAAAHKHVPLMEENPCEAVKNNVRGTRVLAQAAEQCNVDRFILISTDKAVNPTSVMGASKRLAELIVQAQAQASGSSGTSFSIVRFGNVLASNGSVVPRFLEQIKRGGPVTLTHPEMRRFFMLIPEAVQLVLHAAAQAESGATYVLDMGEQVKLLDMARDLIQLSGFVPETEIPIEFIGLRPGEKLYEELAGRDEQVGPSAVDEILRVTSRTPPRADLADAIARIEFDASRGRRDEVLEALRHLTGLAADPESVLPGTSAAAVAHAPVPAGARVDASAPVPTIEDASIEQPCPRCRAHRLHRSRARTLPERVRRNFSARRLFRCDACQWRGWLIPLEFANPNAMTDPAGPDLGSLDETLHTLNTPARRAFTPRDLH
jgi:FlaA1/EpsC-like NDP-sugar epimerase